MQGHASLYRDCQTLLALSLQQCPNYRELGVCHFVSQPGQVVLHFVLHDVAPLDVIVNGAGRVSTQAVHAYMHAGYVCGYAYARCSSRHGSQSALYCTVHEFRAHCARWWLFDIHAHIRVEVAALVPSTSRALV